VTKVVTPVTKVVTPVTKVVTSLTTTSRLRRRTPRPQWFGHQPGRATGGRHDRPVLAPVLNPPPHAHDQWHNQSVTPAWIDRRRAGAQPVPAQPPLCPPHRHPLLCSRSVAVDVLFVPAISSPRSCRRRPVPAYHSMVTDQSWTSPVATRLAFQHSRANVRISRPFFGPTADRLAASASDLAPAAEVVVLRSTSPSQLSSLFGNDYATTSPESRYRDIRVLKLRDWYECIFRGNTAVRGGPEIRLGEHEPAGRQLTLTREDLDDAIRTLTDHT